MSSKPPIRIEHSLYFAILVLAVAIRFIGLGASPLTEAEAQLALPAHQLAVGEGLALGSQPGYVILTGALFTLLGSTDFLARLWPALFGSALVLLPYVWRLSLGRTAALLLALGLAIDPGLIAFSRAASGMVIGLSAALWALAAWRAGRAVWAGILAAIAAYASSHLYLGLLALALAWLLFVRVASADEQQSLRNLVVGESSRRRVLGLSFALTALLGATWLLQLPAGLVAFAAPPADFLQRIVVGGGDPLSLILLALLAYGLLPLVFGRPRAARVWREGDSLGRFLTLFAVVALVLLMLNPGRQVADLVWVLLPLWVLAAQELARYLKLPSEEPRAAFGQAALILLLSAFLLLNLASLSALRVGDSAFNLRLLIVGGVILLGGLASLMIALGWSRQAAAFGLTWSFALIFLFATLAAGWRLAHRSQAANDLWLPEPAAGQAHLLLRVVQDIAEMQSGELHQLAVERQTHSASIGWTLRRFPVQEDALLSQPLVVIADSNAPQPVEAAAYRGQSFVWQMQRAWIEHWPENILAWLIYREGPTQTDEILLWARADLFPGELEVIENETDAEASSP